MRSFITFSEIGTISDDTFTGVACEKEDERRIRELLKRRAHDRKRIYVARHWKRIRYAWASSNWQDYIVAGIQLQGRVAAMLS